MFEEISSLLPSIIRAVVIIAIFFMLFKVMRPFAEQFRDMLRENKKKKEEEEYNRKYMKWNKDNYIKSQQEVERKKPEEVKKDG